MKLPIINTPQYLSATSFSEWNTCPTKFYIKRMSGGEWPIDPQGLPAAVGSAFDCLLSAELAKSLSLDSMPQYKLQTLIEGNVEEPNREKAVRFAGELFEDYMGTGCYARLLNEGITELHPEVRKTLDHNGREVILLGKPDFGMYDGTVVECKVNGAFGKSGAYPKPGYLRCYYNDGTDPKFNHEKRNEFLEDIEVDWARQLSIYTWLQKGLLPFRDIKVAIEQIAVGPKKVAFVSLRSKISKSFQEDLFGSLTGAWKDILEGNIPDAMPSKFTCFKYNQKCVVADRCSAFKDWDNDPYKDLI